MILSNIKLRFLKKWIVNLFFALHVSGRNILNDYPWTFFLHLFLDIEIIHVYKCKKILIRRANFDQKHTQVLCLAKLKSIQLKRKQKQLLIDRFLRMYSIVSNNFALISLKKWNLQNIITNSYFEIIHFSLHRQKMHIIIKISMSDF